jgi:hypothetical protein
MRSVFPRVHLLATVDPHSEALQNFIFVARHETGPGGAIDLGDARQGDFNYPEMARVSELELKPDERELAGALLFSDDYAPVELYAARVVRRYDSQLVRKSRD